MASLCAIKAAGRVKERFMVNILKYSELNEGDVTTYQNLWNAAYVTFGHYYTLKHFHQKRRKAKI